MYPQAQFKVDQFHYNKETKTFSQEISSLGHVSVGRKTQIKITNPKTGGFRLFKFVKADMDSSNEDCYGWNYRSDDGIKLLIIND